MQCRRLRQPSESYTTSCVLGAWAYYCLRNGTCVCSFSTRPALSSGRSHIHSMRTHHRGTGRCHDRDRCSAPRQPMHVRLGRGSTLACVGPLMFHPLLFGVGNRRGALVLRSMDSGNHLIRYPRATYRFSVWFAGSLFVNRFDPEVQ